MREFRGSPGQVIADRYELRELIGQGGMGCVWRAEHRTLHTAVAVKLLSPGTGAEEALLARFSREAQAAASLRGPNVVHILDHGVDAGTAYIAMEYLEGETLGSRLRRECKLSPAEAAPILTGVVRAIARAHRSGVVHRDLKPENIFLARDEESGLEIVKVLDFGIAKLVRSDGVASGASYDFASTDGATNTGVMLGTPCYVSPEQARGLKDLDSRTDLWSFGVIAFECLTGRKPFDAGVLAQLMLQICVDPIPCPSDFGPVPAGFDAWFSRATQRERRARFQTVRELAAELAAVLTPGKAWLDGSAEIDTGDKTATTSPTADTVEAPSAPPNAVSSTTASHVTSESERAAAAGARGRARRGRVVTAAILAVLAVGGLVVAVTRRPDTPAASATAGGVSGLPAPSAVEPPLPASATAGSTASTSASTTASTSVLEPPPPAVSATSAASASSKAHAPAARPTPAALPGARHHGQAPAPFGSTNLGI